MITSIITGCAQMDSPAASAPKGPDLAAIITVVEDVYATEGRGRMIFLGTVDDTIDEADLQQARTRLEAGLGIAVKDDSEADRSDPALPALTPVDPETGEIGISIYLGRFTVDGDARLRVEATFARSGLDGMVVEYVLESTPQGWNITERTTIANA